MTQDQIVKITVYVIFTVGISSLKESKSHDHVKLLEK